MVAHFLYLSGAFGVDVGGGRRDLVGEGENGAVEGVEGCEVGVEGGGGGGERFACGVHLDGEEGKCVVHCEEREVCRLEESSWAERRWFLCRDGRLLWVRACCQWGGIVAA